MRVIVTRPQREAKRWVDDLRQLGLEPVALPLIEIRDADDPEPLRAAWRMLAGYRAVMFVSANAVSRFFAHQPVAAGAWDGQGVSARAWVTGPGSRRALEDSGLACALIDAPPTDSAQFDSETLWLHVKAQVGAGDRVLIVRGADARGTIAGREWLGDQLRAVGVHVDTVAAYQRRLPELGPLQRDQAVAAAADGSVWLFSSTEAATNLGALLPGQHWGSARAVATHPRIADEVRRIGFGVVCPSRPQIDAIVASIKSCR